MAPKELDVVLLKDGREATIVHTFDGGSAFMAEVADEKGRTIDMPVVLPDDIVRITYTA